MRRCLCLALTFLLPLFGNAATMLKCEEIAPFHPQRKTQWIQVSILPGAAAEGSKAFVFLRMSHGVQMQTEEQIVREVRSSQPMENPHGPATHSRAFMSADRKSDFYLRVDQTGDQMVGRFFLTTWQGEISIQNMKCREVEVRTAAECAALLEQS